MDSLIKITSIYAEITKTDYEMKMSNLLSICEHERALYGITKLLLLHTGSGFQWYRTYERGYETSGSSLRFMLRRSSLVECVSVNRWTVLLKSHQSMQKSQRLIMK
jgi:uncharacterized membrane-anchored protein